MSDRHAFHDAVAHFGWEIVDAFHLPQIVDWATSDPAPAWVRRLTGWLMLGMVAAVIGYGFWSYR